MKRFFVLSIVILAPYFAVAQPNPVPKPRHAFTVTAHRGDHVIYPENTSAAYASAIKNGADYVEIDLRTTKDGHLVSMHDNTLTRMTGVKAEVKDLTLAEIEQLQIKSPDSLDKTIYRVSTFEQILSLCKNKIYIYIDFKQASTAQTYTLLKKYGMEKQVIIYINAPAQLTDWRKVAPQMPLMLSLPGNVKDVAALKNFVDEFKPDVLDGDWTDYTPEMVSAARAMDIPCWPDIQSKTESKNWDDALSKGFTGLQTDHPAELIKYLKQKGLR